MWGETGAAFCRACSTAISETSMSVTSQSCLASQMECRPAPPARSRAWPACGKMGKMYCEKAHSKKGSGVAQVSGEASRYFLFQRSRSLFVGALSVAPEEDAGIPFNFNRLSNGFDDSGCNWRHEWCLCRG